MEERTIKNSQIQEFSDYLVREEKSDATCEKYIRDIRGFQLFAGSNQVTKELAVAWKKQLMEQGYAVRSINSMLASVNSFLRFLGWNDCKVKNIRLQHQTYCAEDKELTKAEYMCINIHLLIFVNWYLLFYFKMVEYLRISAGKTAI